MSLSYQISNIILITSRLSFEVFHNYVQQAAYGSSLVCGLFDKCPALCYGYSLLTMTMKDIQRPESILPIQEVKKKTRHGGPSGTQVYKVPISQI